MERQFLSYSRVCFYFFFQLHFSFSCSIKFTNNLRCQFSVHTALHLCSKLDMQSTMSEKLWYDVQRTYLINMTMKKESNQPTAE